jgi:catechol 2,3-dioxygenase-like lactoylglutathione lyase family enzyme
MFHGLSHMTFIVADLDRSEACRDRLLALGLEVREGRTRVEGEGRSLYFHDFDNHLFEVHTGTLEQRLATYAALQGGTNVPSGDALLTAH